VGRQQRGHQQGADAVDPFNPIFRPASWLIVAVREFPVTTARSPASRARVRGLHAGPDRGRLHPGSPVPA
jgi:hypothetical protein